MRPWRAETLSEHQALALGLGHGVSESLGRVDPQAYGRLGMIQGINLCVAVRNAARKLRDLGNERLVGVTPIDNDLVLVHANSHNRCLRTVWRILRLVVTGGL